MDATPPPLTPENLTPSATSLTARMTNVFVSPSEVFDEVKLSRPNQANWVAPMIISVIVGIIYTMVVFSQPAIFQRMKDAQDKKYQELVDSGKMKQADVDKAREMTDKFMTPTFFKVIGIVSAIFMNGMMFFLAAFFLYLVGRFALRGQFDYMVAVEVVGLSSLIGAVGGIVAMLLAVIYGDMMMTPGPILLVSHVDPNNKVHVLVSALNLMTLWWLAVLAIGLARLCNAGFIKAAAWIFGSWYGVWALFALGLPLLVKGR